MHSARFIGTVCLLLATSSIVACGDDEPADGGGGAGEGGESPGGNGTGGDNAGGGNEAAWQAYCDARDAACELEDVSVCYEQQACARALLRDEVEETFFSCLASECGDGCTGDVAEQHSQTATAEAFQQACLIHVEECQTSDDLCFIGYLIPDGLIATVDACLHEPTCAESAACIDAFNVQFDECEGWQ